MSKRKAELASLITKLDQRGIWAEEEIQGSPGFVSSCLHIIGLNSPEMKQVLATLLDISVEEIPKCYRIERIAWLQLLARYIAYGIEESKSE